MDIVLGAALIIVGCIFMVSGIFEFKLLCIVDWIGTVIGLIMALIGASTIYGAL